MLTPSMLLVILLSYLLGAIPFALLVARLLYGVDVQQAGSGNAGARNTLLIAGPLAALLVALLDAGKAALAMLLGWLVAALEGAAICGALAVVGHCFSPYLIARWRGSTGSGWKLALRRSGGKGLASGAAVLLLIAWPAALVVLAIVVVARLLIWDDETWPTLVALPPAVPICWWWTGSATVGLAMTLVALVIGAKHLPDLRITYYVDR